MRPTANELLDWISKQPSTTAIVPASNSKQATAMATPLPPSTIGTGALYSPSSAGTNSNAQPRFSPFAHFSSLHNDGIGNDTLKKSSGLPDGIPTTGRLLAVNSSFIAYAVKKGLVRVIDRKSADKTLLRGHDEKTRMVDAAFFGESSGKEGVGGLWDQLAAERSNNSAAGISGDKAPLPPAAASDVLATLSGMAETASILIWRIHSSPSTGLGADKLLEVRFKEASRLVWHPFNPNRFLLLSRNLGGGDSYDNSDEEGGRERTVATLCETTRLVTRPHESEGHMVCDCTPTSADSSGIPGMIPLIVSGDNTSLAGANDVSWSSKDARYVLTAHDDGNVRLWDLTATSAPSAGEGGEDVSISSAGELNVTNSTNATSQRVTRVMFLSQYECPPATSGEYITPPFITGTDMNHTITLWSGWKSNGGVPQRLRVFGLRNNDEDADASYPLSSILSVELIPAPYRPPVVNESIVPSSFVLLAERSSGGVLHALHLDTQWKEDGDGVDGGRSAAVVVKGFDYVSTLNCVHPVYSYCVAPTSNEGDPTTATLTLAEERDVDLACIQSKAVQMLSLSAEMIASPEDDMVLGMDRTNLAPGVSLLDLPSVDASDEEGDEGDDDEEEFEEDYDMDEDELATAEYPTDDDDEDEGEEEDNEKNAVPTATEDEPNAFSNWLGAIANPLPPPTTDVADSAPKPVSPVPPGLGFASILPPPPGMAPPPAPATLVDSILDQKATTPAALAEATVNKLLLDTSIENRSPPTFLSPMQLLSGSGSDLDISKAAQPEPTPVTVEAPSPVPPSIAPLAPAAAPASKPPMAKKTSKKKDNVKNKQPSLSPMKILQRAASPILPPAAAAAPNTDVNTVEATVQRTMKAHSTELLASMQKIIANEVSTQVGKAVRSSFKEANKTPVPGDKAMDKKLIEQAIQKALASSDKSTEQAVQRALVTSIAENGELRKQLERQARESAAMSAKEAVGAMQPLIMNSVNQTMREVLIPAYENATRAMFQQTSVSLEKGLSQMNANQANSTNQTLQAMSAQMMKMGQAIQSLSAEVTQLRGVVASGNQNGTALQQQQQQQQQAPPKPMNIRDEIKALCQAKRFEEAFTKAVSATDGDTALFACKNADSAVVFNGEVSISQPILICLMQQLGAVLVSTTDTGDIKTILSWLQEIAVTIDPTNSNIQGYIASVVQQLLANINSKMSNCDPSFRRPLQTLMQVIRGLL